MTNDITRSSIYCHHILQKSFFLLHIAAFLYTSTTDIINFCVQNDMSYIHQLCCHNQYSALSILYYLLLVLQLKLRHQLTSTSQPPSWSTPGQTRGNGFICLNYLIVKIFLLSLIFIIFHILNVRQQYLACSNHYPCLLLIVSLISSIIKERMKQKYG